MTQREPWQDKIFVTVTSIFDKIGYMKPCSIIWQDGREFTIEKVKDFMPAESISPILSGTCYTVVIRGTEKHLFFEPYSSTFSGKTGRWYVVPSDSVPV